MQIETTIVITAFATAISTVLKITLSVAKRQNNSIQSMLSTLAATIESTKNVNKKVLETATIVKTLDKKINFMLDIRYNKDEYSAELHSTVDRLLPLFYNSRYKYCIVDSTNSLISIAEWANDIGFYTVTGSKNTLLSYSAFENKVAVATIKVATALETAELTKELYIAKLDLSIKTFLSNAKVIFNDDANGKQIRLHTIFVEFLTEYIILVKHFIDHKEESYAK